MKSQSRIRMARRRAGLSQSELADRIGVQRSAVSHWEGAGGRNPSIANMRRIAEIAGVHFEWLATGRGNMSVSSEVLLDSIEAADGLLIDDDLEIRLLRAFRKVPVAARVALIEISEFLSRSDKHSKSEG